MAAQCKLIQNKKGKTIGVEDSKGNSSKLFKKIMSIPTLTLEQGLSIFKNTLLGKTFNQNKVEKYLYEANKVKNRNPKKYITFDVASRKTLEESKVIDINGYMGFVTKDGELKGLFKYKNVEGVTVDMIISDLVNKGGIKLDNYDGFLTDLYIKNGFRVVSRIPFNSDYAPQGWDYDSMGTPDVVYMIYDPANSLEIEERIFSNPNDAENYRDSFTEKINLPSTVKGNRLFSNPLKDASVLAEAYMKSIGLTYESFEGITQINTKKAKAIAELYQLMDNNPSNPEVREAYEAMIEETVAQYKMIVEKGYSVEINNNEPYNSSSDMIQDLRENKNMKIFSTESGFGAEGISDKQRKENPLLKDTGLTDLNGVPLLANDIFRFVHDFFGHAKLGNGFGAVGEENAWQVHSRMYSPKARRAMTSETRGQNSFVNFSGVNDKVFEKRDEARRLRKEGKVEEASKLTEEVYEEMKFAEQKVGLLPEWVSELEDDFVESREPSLNFSNSTGENYKTFSEALKNTLSGTLSIKLGDEVVFEIDVTPTGSDFKSNIFTLIREDILTGEVVLDADGELVYQTKGGTTQAKIVSAEIAKDLLTTTLGRKNVKQTLDSNLKISDDLHLIKLDNGLEITKEDFKSGNFSALEDKFGREIALKLLGANSYQSFQKTTSNTVFKEEVDLNFESENELQSKLVNLLNDMGVKITSITDYLTKYASKNGLPASASALADIANRIVAFKNGEISMSDLTEEVSHFIVETWNASEVEAMLKSIDKTEEYKEHNENYRNIYTNQNPNASEQEIEDMVRREVLGKILANSLLNNFSNENKTEVQKRFINKIADLFTEFINKIIDTITPNQESELKKFTQKVYMNLMSDELLDNLDLTQLESNKLLLFSASNSAEDARKLMQDKVFSSTEILSSQAALDRLNNRDDIDEVKRIIKFNESDIGDLSREDLVKATQGIVSIYKKNINYLNQRIKKNKTEPLTQEETAVFITTQGSLSEYVSSLMSLLDKNSPKESNIIESVAELNDKLSQVRNFRDIAHKNLWDAHIDKVAKKWSLTEKEVSDLKKSFLEHEKDTNWFFSQVSSMVHAQNPLLNMASDLVAELYTTSNINTVDRVKSLMNKFQEIGFDPKTLKNFIEDGYIKSSVKWAQIDKDVFEKRWKTYNEIKGLDLKQDDFRKLLNNNELDLTAEQKDEYNDVVEQFKKDNIKVDPLTKEARQKREDIYLGRNESEDGYGEISKEVIRADKKFSRQRGFISNSARENGSYTQADVHTLQEINRQREQMKSPFNEDGTLIEGLMFDSEGQVIGNGSVLSDQARRVLELNILDRRRTNSFKGKTSGNKISSEFYEKLQELEGDAEAQVEFLLLNANVSFTSEFWDSLTNTNGVVSKLEELEQTEETIDLIDNIKEVQKRRSIILKQNKVYNQPSETNYGDMPSSNVSEIKNLSEKLQALYREAKLLLPKNEHQSVDEEMSFSSVTNQAFQSEIELKKNNQEIIDFITKHVTSSDKVSIESLKSDMDKYLNGTKAKIVGFGSRVFSMQYDGLSQGAKKEKMESELIEHAKTKLLPYFKRIEPNVETSYTQTLEQLKSGEKNVVDFVKDVEKNNTNFLSIIPNYIFNSEETSDELSEEYLKNKELGREQVQEKYANKEGYYDYFGIDYNSNSTAPTKNTKDFQALNILMDFHEKTLEKTKKTNSHNKYLLPQQGMRGARQVQKLFSNVNMQNLNEVLKDMTTYREDEKEYGQSSDGSAKNAKDGSLTIPRYGFNKLENQEDVTDELLASYSWMAHESEIYEARVDTFAKMETIKDMLLNRDWGGKSAENSQTYKMFDSFYRYSIYGQNETFSYETDMFGLLPKKVNLAPLAKKLQTWVRLVNLGFSFIVPVTSILQGGLNVAVERFVGERMDKDAMRLANRKLAKFVQGAASDSLKLSSKSEMNSIAEFFGVFNVQERFENSNYGKAFRGALKSAFLSHTIADAPIKGTVILTTLNDFRVVNGDIINFNRFVQIQKSMDANKSTEDIRKEWRKYEDNVLLNYLKTVDGVTKFNSEKLSEDLVLDQESDEFKEILQVKTQAVRDFMKTAVQEIDTMIPSEERSVAQRHAIFSFMFLHRGWMSVAYNRKFKSRHLNTHTGLVEEGNFSGTVSFLRDMIKEARSPENNKTFMKSFKDSLKNADSTTKRSLRRTASEFVLTNAMVALSLVLMSMADDEEDDAWVAQFGAYMSYRVSNEVLSSNFAYPSQIFDFLESPVVGLDKIKQTKDILDLFDGDLVEAGKYKDYSKRQRWIYKNLPASKEYFNVVNAKKTRDTYEFYNRSNMNFAITSWFLSQNQE